MNFFHFVLLFHFTAQLGESLGRLEVDSIDLYYMHRMDPSTPIEETMQCLKELVTEGKIKYIGLSECTAAELRRAHKVHSVTCVQMEWSLCHRDIEKKLLPLCRELGVGVVPYSPLGRGLLAGAVSEGIWICKANSSFMESPFNNTMFSMFLWQRVTSTCEFVCIERRLECFETL